MIYKDYVNYMNSIDEEIIKKAKNIKLLILDVDGVLSDGGIYISEDNIESKKFYAQDGHGMMLLKNIGIEIAIISGRYSKAVEIKMTLTAPGCGMGDMIATEVKQKIEGVPGSNIVTVELVWDPPWDREMINEAARLQLGML